MLLVCVASVCSVSSCWLPLSSSSSYASAIGFNKSQKVIRFVRSMRRLTMYCCHCTRSEVVTFFMAWRKFVVDSGSAVCYKWLQIIPLMNVVLSIYDSGFPLIVGWKSKNCCMYALTIVVAFPNFLSSSCRASL